MDDVGADEVEMGRRSGRQDEAAALTDRRALGEERLRVGSGVRGEIVELPLELAGDGPDLEVGLG